MRTQTAKGKFCGARKPVLRNAISLAEFQKLPITSQEQKYDDQCSMDRRFEIVVSRATEEQPLQAVPSCGPRHLATRIAIDRLVLDNVQMKKRTQFFDKIKPMTWVTESREVGLQVPFGWEYRTNPWHDKPEGGLVVPSSLWLGSVEHEVPIYFGPLERGDTPILPPLICEEPDPTRIEQPEKQVVVVQEWRDYEFPKLDHVGYHNVSLLSGSERKYVLERGYFFHQVNMTVTLPADLVPLLSSFWVHKAREATLKDFELCTNKCREIISRTTMTADQCLDAVMYAPALAYLDRWAEKSNVERVVAGDYVHSGCRESLKRFLLTLRNFQHTSLVRRCVLVLMLGLIFWFSPPLHEVVRTYQELPVSVIEPRWSRQCWLEVPLLPLSKWLQSPFPEWLITPDQITPCITNHTTEQFWLISRAAWDAQWSGGLVLWIQTYNSDYVDVLRARLENLLGCSTWNGGLLSGDISVSLEWSWYSLTEPEPTCVGFTTGRLFRLSRKMWNKMMHSINGNRLHRPVTVLTSDWYDRKLFVKLGSCKQVALSTYLLENCAHLPRPKAFKPGARLKFVGAGRGNLRYKAPNECRGTQVLYGFDTESYSPTAFASNEHNELQALNARVLADTLPPTDDLPACIAWCKKNHQYLFPRMHNIRSVGFDEYISRSNASPSVKKILQATHVRLQSQGVNESSDLGAPRWRWSNRTRQFEPIFSSTVRKWTTRSSFVKVENNLYDSPLGTKDKAPRLIQGATPEFICLVGPWVMAVQDKLKRRWGKDNNLVFTSGLTGEESAQLYANIKHTGGRYVEDDLGKFDCSIRIAWCMYELWLFRRWGAPLAVEQLVFGNIYTHGYTAHGWKYECLGTRKSGDPYTSLMNSVINGLSHLYLYCKWTEKTVLQAQQSIFMLLQGDDNAMWHQEKKLFPWRQGMAELGFDSEALYRDELNEVEFCSCRLYRTSVGWCFGPKPGKVLAKLGYIVNAPRSVSRESMMRGVALGLRKSCSFIPPLKVVIDRVLELTSGHEAYYQRNFLEHTMKVIMNHEVTPDIEYGLYKTYYWSHGSQSSFATAVKQMQLGDNYKNTVVELLFDKDTSGPKNIFVAA